MKAKFELRKEKVTKDGLIPIQLVVRYNSKRLRKNTGHAVLEHHWNGHRINKNKKSEPDNNYEEINNALQKIEGRTQDYFANVRLGNIQFTKEGFDSLFENEKILDHDGIDFFECFKDYIEQGKRNKTENTTKGQNTVKNFLSNFSTETGNEITFEKIDFDFYEKFWDYSYGVKGIKQNYFSKIIRVLKSFLNWATDKGFNKNMTFNKFKAPEHDINIIFLTLEELMNLYKFDFQSRRLEHVRDIYCLGCFTGLRYSDLSKLHLANISENHIHISIQKTKTQNHVITLNDYAKEILRKYKDTIYEPIPIISAQKFNKYLKECCKDAGIDQPITVHWFVGNKKKTETRPKHKFVTSHTARKTHITLSRILGMDREVVM